MRKITKYSEHIFITLENYGAALSTGLTIL